MNFKKRIWESTEKDTSDRTEAEIDLLEAVKFSLETLEVMWPSPHLNFGLLEW